MKRSLVAALVLLLVSCAAARAQSPARAGATEVVDRMVAVVNGRELITYTDLLWQLALQPDVPLEQPRLEDLRRALDLVVDQRLISQEAEKLPSVAPTNEEISNEINHLIKTHFGSSQSAFYARLARVGLGEDSTQLREIVQDRVRIRKYLDFRFRSFTVVTPQEVGEYYRDVYVPRHRRQRPGVVVPKLEDVFKELQNELAEGKVESDTDEFLEEARAAAEITILDERLKDRG
ncbi:MAG TPA: hypothetical protein VK422_03055 [Pyrinomonadaceae bacterium]|nr:hypothetical protein [Pyrinomonadaceae bacterium]